MVSLALFDPIGTGSEPLFCYFVSIFLPPTRRHTRWGRRANTPGPSCVQLEDLTLYGIFCCCFHLHAGLASAAGESLTRTVQGFQIMVIIGSLISAREYFFALCNIKSTVWMTAWFCDDVCCVLICRSVIECCYWKLRGEVLRHLPPSPPGLHGNNPTGSVRCTSYW